MPKYSHTLSLHFSVVSDDPDGAVSCAVAQDGAAIITTIDDEYV